MRICSIRFLVRAILGVTLVVGIVAPPVAAQSMADADVDLVLGTWTLNIEKSRFHPGPGPKSQTRTYASHPDGVKVTLDSVDADGKSRTVEYTANVDSLEYPVTGTANIDTVALKAINAHTAEAVLRHANKIIGTARRVISEDGRTLTIDYEGRGRDGSQVEITAVYEKKDDS